MQGLICKERKFWPYPPPFQIKMISNCKKYSALIFEQVSAISVALSLDLTVCTCWVYTSELLCSPQGAVNVSSVPTPCSAEVIFSLVGRATSELRLLPGLTLRKKRHSCYCQKIIYFLKIIEALSFTEIYII